MELKFLSHDYGEAQFYCINRTFMELKWRGAVREERRQRYQSNLYGIEIEEHQHQSGSPPPYQSNLYGIEICKEDDGGGWWHGYQSNLYGIEIGTPRNTRNTTERINRTFMELKSACADARQGDWWVSIEPLWNWNHAGNVRYASTCRVSIEPLWNWNGRKPSSNELISCINRTFMELKFIKTNVRYSISIVSIEPLWNWNLIMNV